MPVLISSTYNEAIHECLDTLTYTAMDHDLVSVSYTMDGVGRSFDFHWVIHPDNMSSMFIELKGEKSLYDMYAAFNHIRHSSNPTIAYTCFYALDPSLIDLAIAELPFNYMQSSCRGRMEFINGIYLNIIRRPINLYNDIQQISEYANKLISSIGYEESVLLELNDCVGYIGWDSNNGTFIVDGIPYYLQISTIQIADKHYCFIGTSIGTPIVITNQSTLHYINVLSSLRTPLIDKLTSMDIDSDIIGVYGFFDSLPTPFGILLSKSLSEISGAMNLNSTCCCLYSKIRNTSILNRDSIVDIHPELNRVSIEHSQKFKDYLDELRTNTRY